MADYYDGTYLFRVTDQKMTRSSNDNPQLVLTGVPLGRMRNGSRDDLEECQDLEQRIFVTITAKTIDFVIDQLAAIGFQGSKLSSLDPQSQEHQSFIGDEIEVWCKHEIYEGKEKIKWNISSGKSYLAPMEPGDLRKLDALFGRQMKEAFGSGNSSKSKVKNDTVKPAARQAAEDDLAPDMDDGIPF